jgi:hypothetical protein
MLKAKLESVESGIETFDSAFLAQIVMPNNTTVGDLLTPQLVSAYKTGRMPKALMPAPDEAQQPRGKETG